MVERGPRFPNKNLSRREFLKLSALIGSGLTLSAAMTACGLEASPVSAAEPQPKNDIPSPTATETSPVIEASPTAETMPSSFESNRKALEEMGYTFQRGEMGTELISPQGQLVASSIDGLTITTYGQNSELTVSPEHAFSVEKTIGAGMEQLLVLKDTQGNITHTFLERAGHWAPLAEIQTNPREIENYPQVAIEDLWNGRLAQSEALTAEPFPEGTLVPDKFVYYLWFSSQGYFVQLRDVVNGVNDTSYSYPDVINHNNDYRRWTNFYRSQTPEGVDIIIATEQILMPDGETSLFLHHVIGGERPWEGPNTLNHKEDLIQNIFLARTEPAPNESLSLTLRPIVFSSQYNTTDSWGISYTREPNAGISMYGLPQNNPTDIKDGLEEFLRNQYENFDRTIPNGPIGDVGDEIEAWQYMGLTSSTGHGIYEGYFQN